MDRAVAGMACSVMRKPCSLRVTSTASHPIDCTSSAAAAATLIFAADGTMHRGGEFLGVRRNQCCAAINAVVVPFGSTTTGRPSRLAPSITARIRARGVSTPLA